MYDTQYYSKLPDACAGITGTTDYSALASLLSTYSSLNSCKARSIVPTQGPCYPIYIPTVDLYNRCLPDTAAVAGLLGNVASGANSTISNSAAANRAQRYASDVVKGIMLILVSGLAGGIVLSMLWILILRFFAGLMAWGVIIFVNLMSAACTIKASQKAGLQWTGSKGIIQGGNLSSIGITTTNYDKRIWEVATYVGIAVTAVIFLFTLLIIRRVKVRASGPRRLASDPAFDPPPPLLPYPDPRSQWRASRSPPRPSPPSHRRSSSPSSPSSSTASWRCGGSLLPRCSGPLGR